MHFRFFRINRIKLTVFEDENLKMKYWLIT